jgi:hypothetical protein
MQGINFFIVGTALVVAGYGAAFQGGNFLVAAGMALLGGGVTLAFWMLDVRTRQLVKAAEVPLRVLQERLARDSGLASLELVEAVERPQQGASSYSGVLRVLYVAVAGLMVVAVIAALAKAAGA